MIQLVDVTFEQIEVLTDRQLTDLLNMLLHLEAVAYNIPSSAVGVSLKINVGDGGEDGRIKWEEGPECTNWIPKRFVLFQCKATDMPAANCKKEICKNDSTELKPRVEEVLDCGGSYVLFYGRECNTERQVPRVNAFREALRKAGKEYSDTANIQIYDANKIASWVKEYIPAIIAVHNWTGKALPEGFQTWRMWEGYQENRFTYVQDETLKGHLKQLRDFFCEPRRVARIVGLSGLGKTRLAFETFRPPDNPEENLMQQSLSDQTIYIDASFIREKLVYAISQLRVQQLKGILVIDNCELELHQLLQREVQHNDSQLSLLTLDYNPEELSTDIPQINLKQVSDEVIKELIKQAYPGLIQADVSRIVEFAQGFPQMAVLLAEARLKDEVNIGSLNNDFLVKKLIWGNKSPNQDAYKVISACSLFELLGYAENVSDQRQFVSNKICRMDDEIFYGFAQDFVKRGILDRRHRFIRVVPRPLAIRLAADWWSKCTPERAKKLIMEEMPKGMAEALCAQMAMLHFVPEAQAAVSDLCGDLAPFGQAEVLNSEKGSRLFRSLVEVNPQATVKALEKVFGGWPREQLFEVGPGRRNLVRAIEKLCFWDETFPLAAKLMLAFAAAENETWGNNSTNQFLQLFHVYLSGTQAPPTLRIQIIDDALSMDDVEFRKLGVKALGHALKSQHFSRMGSVERQGSRAAMKDWTPIIWEEIFDYWRQCLNRLTSIASGNDEISILAREQIIINIRGLVRSGLMKEIDTCLKTVLEKRGNFWPEAFKTIQDSIKFEGPRIPEEGRNQLTEWLKLLSPKLISEKLKLLISVPSWSHVKDKDGNYIDLAEQEAITFAEECATKTPELFQNLNIIFHGEQRKGYIFGYTLAGHLIKLEQFIKESLSTLANLDPKESSSIVLGGFLAALKVKYPALVKETLELVANDDVLYVHAVDLTRLIEPDMEDLKRLVKLLEKGRINWENLRSFSYGRVLSYESPELIISFCEDIINVEPQALPAAFEILYMYSHQENDKFNKCKEEVRKILLTPGLLNDSKMCTTDIYNWQEIIERLLTSKERDEDLAKHIAFEIINACSDDRVSYEWDNTIKTTIGILLKNYPQVTWPILSKGLLSNDWFLRHNLTYLLSPRVESEQSNRGVLSLLSDDFLIKWCKDNPERGPNILAETIPVLVTSQEGWTFHPIAKFLINTYGDKKEVLSDIYRNMGPSSWYGSIIPYYEQQIQAVETVINHPKSTVRDWAKMVIEGLRQEIQREKKIEEERDFGVYD